MMQTVMALIDDASGITRGRGPTDGLLSAEDDDGLTVSFEFCRG